MTEYDSQGRRILLVATYPELPPTSNKLYILGSKMTDAAREYKGRFSAYVSQYYQHQILELPNACDPSGRDFNPLVVFSLHLWLYTNLLTSWDDASMSPSKRAKTRYKRIDLSNRIKLIEDCIKTVIDIDDSLTFVAGQTKVHEPDPEKERITFQVSVIYDPAPFNIPPLPPWWQGGPV